MNKSTVNLLPGPVEVKSNVRQAFQDSVVSHRSEEFINDFSSLKDKMFKKNLTLELINYDKSI